MTSRSRTMPSRPSVYFILSILAGLVLSFGWFQLWRLYLPKQQSLYLTSYAITSIPHPRKLMISAQIANTLLHERIVRTVQRVYVTNVHSFFAGQIYHDQPITQILRTPAIGVGVILFISLLVGCILYAIRLRHTKDGIQLRGPELLTPSEFNRTQKGKCFELEIS